MLNFVEKFETECNGVGDFEHNQIKKGLRLEEHNRGKRKGIKEHLKLRNLSSCDYFVYKKEKACIIVDLIEFTDLKKQKEEIENKLLCLKKNKLKELWKENCNCEVLKGRIERLNENQIKSIIIDEFRKKVIESIVIFFKMWESFQLKKEKLINIDFVLYIYICQGIDDIIFIENLKNNLKSIINGITKEVKIETVKK